MELVLLLYMFLQKIIALLCFTTCFPFLMELPNLCGHLCSYFLSWILTVLPYSPAYVFGCNATPLFKGNMFFYIGTYVGFMFSSYLVNQVNRGDIHELLYDSLLHNDWPKNHCFVCPFSFSISLPSFKIDFEEVQAFYAWSNRI